MKKYTYGFLLLFYVIFSTLQQTLASSLERHSVTSFVQGANERMIISPKDPDYVRFLSTWDWWTDGFDPVYMVGFNEPNGYLVRRPHFDLDNSPVVSNYLGQSDYLPQEGWELFYRDFGAPDRKINVPVLMLYNKYRGILRIYVWRRPPVNTANMGRWDVRIVNNKAALFNNYADEDNSFIDKYDPLLVQTSTARLGAGWCMTEIDLAGYDASVNGLSPAPYLEFNYSEFQVSNLTMTGMGSLTGTAFGTAVGTVGGKKEGPPKLISNGLGFLKDASALSKFFDGATKVASIIPKIGAVAGVVKSIMGFIPTSDPPKPVNMSISLRMQGRINLEASGEVRQDPPFLVQGLRIYLPGYVITPPPLYGNAIIRYPVYTKPLGVYNIKNFTMTSNFLQEFSPCNGGGTISNALYSWKTTPISYTFNPEARLRVISVGFNFVISNDKTVSGDVINNNMDGGIQYFNWIGSGQVFTTVVFTFRCVSIDPIDPSVPPDSPMRGELLITKAFRVPNTITSQTITVGECYEPGRIAANESEVIPSVLEVTHRPNPFTSQLTIDYHLPKRTSVQLKVYDVAGREVGSLVDEEKSPGNYSATLNGSNLRSGVYFYRMKAGEVVLTRRIVLVK